MTSTAGPVRFFATLLRLTCILESEKMSESVKTVILQYLVCAVLGVIEKQLLMHLDWMLPFPAAVNQTASTTPKTWRKPNDAISASDAPQKEDEVCKYSARCHLTNNQGVAICFVVRRRWRWRLFKMSRQNCSRRGRRDGGRKGGRRQSRGTGTMWVIVQVENASTCVAEEADLNDFGVLLSPCDDGQELSFIYTFSSSTFFSQISSTSVRLPCCFFTN